MVSTFLPPALHCVRISCSAFASLLEHEMSVFMINSPIIQSMHKMLAYQMNERKNGIYMLSHTHNHTNWEKEFSDRIHSILFRRVLSIISLFRSANESHYLLRPFFFPLSLSRLPFFALFQLVRREGLVGERLKRRIKMIHLPFVMSS